MMWVEGLAMMVKNFIRPKEPSVGFYTTIKKKGVALDISTTKKKAMLPMIHFKVQGRWLGESKLGNCVGRV